MIDRLTDFRIFHNYRGDVSLQKEEHRKMGYRTVKEKKKKKNCNNNWISLVQLLLLPFCLYSNVRMTNHLPLCLCRSMPSWWVTLPSPMTTSLRRLSPTLQASTASPWWVSPPACLSTLTRWVMNNSRRCTERCRGRERGREQIQSEAVRISPWGGFKSFLD